MTDQPIGEKFLVMEKDVLDINWLLHLTAKDPLRPKLQGIYLDDKTMKAYAADGFVAGWCFIPESLMQFIGKVIHIQDENGKLVKHVKKLTFYYAYDVNRGEEENKYPDLSQFVEKDPPLFQVALDAWKLGRMLSVFPPAETLDWRDKPIPIEAAGRPLLFQFWGAHHVIQMEDHSGHTAIHMPMDYGNVSLQNAGAVNIARALANRFKALALQYKDDPEMLVAKINLECARLEAYDTWKPHSMFWSHIQEYAEA